MTFVTKRKHVLSKSLLVFALMPACLLLIRQPARAQQASDTSKPAAAPASSPLSVPGMTGLLTINPSPLYLGTKKTGGIYVSGVVSAMGQWQSNPASSDRSVQADLTNAQVFIQKVDGIFQFFIQAGSYSLPDLGAAYVRAGNTTASVMGATNTYYGVIPQWFIKIAPSNNFSIMVGKLPTLIGAEYTFSFENMNIERGLVWNQENAVNRGVQLNYKTGPVTLAVSWNDGLYSNQYTWAWGSVSYAINASNTLSVIGGGNTQITRDSTPVTPIYLNNEQIYNLIYSHISGPWTIEPYFQFTSVPQSPQLYTSENAATYGGALFVNYAFPSKTVGASFNLPLRLEYIHATGSAAKGAPNLLYGDGSSAWSFTVTPTFQYNRFFARAEFSYVQAENMSSGFGFGAAGTNTSQVRLVTELGWLF